MKIVKATILALVITLLNACSFIKPIDKYNSIESKNDSSLASSISIPSIPVDWKYYKCPKSDYCGNLSIAFPAESNGPLEIQEGNVHASYGVNQISFIIQKTQYRVSSLEESALCMDMDIKWQNENCPRVKQYIVNQPSYSILKFITPSIKNNSFLKDNIFYLIQTKDQDFTVNAYAKTLDDQKFLDTTMLNLKIDSNSSGAFLQ